MNQGARAKRARDVGEQRGEAAYERRRPEKTVLYATVREHWKTFLADLEARVELPALPAFVMAEVEGFLRCGTLAHGFVLARCGDCGPSLS